MITTILLEPNELVPGMDVIVWRLDELSVESNDDCKTAVYRVIDIDNVIVLCPRIGDEVIKSEAERADSFASNYKFMPIAVFTKENAPKGLFVIVNNGRFIHRSLNAESFLEPLRVFKKDGFYNGQDVLFGYGNLIFIVPDSALLIPLYS